MPTCPMCGEDFTKGGAFTTHAQHCDAAPEDLATGDMGPEDKRFRERVIRLEEQLSRLLDSDDLDRLWKLVMTTEGRVPSNSRLGKYEDGLKRLDRLQERVDSLFVACPICGTEMAAPREPGEGDCPGCGGTLKFGSHDIPTGNGSNGEVRTTR